ncbi:endothelial PAS domain-containing protein 1-like [Haliotis asinina]|uniref:endothelial PAS domain-containing protein 1-like n=1 Tax=Haliotis asinina TaxID=109174 RepID=UPI003531C340
MSLDKRLKPAMPLGGDEAESRPWGISRAVKSKLAAKARRDQESIELANVCEVLPFTISRLSKLDKSSIIRLAITYIHMKTWIQTAIVQKGNAISCLQADEGDDWKSHKSKTGDELVCQNSLNTRLHASQPQIEEGQLMLETLQGFVMFVKKNGTILYVSDTVEQHLGYKQENLLGTSVIHIIHPEDMTELSKQFKISISNKTSDASANARDILQTEQKCSFLVRMKFSRNDDRSRQTGFMLVQWTGRLRLRPSRKACGYAIEGLVCMCQPIQTNSILEIRMGGSMFISRHDLGMRFTYCDPRIITLIGYEPSEVIGKTAYYFHNPLDAPKISDCHSNLIVKGTSVSKYYRFFGKTGDWIWLQTRATIIYNTSQKPQYVVCMNYVIGEEEGQRYLTMEEEQQGFRDPNVRGCIDLANTSTESPVSICSSSGDEGHDDTGYSSGYSHTTDTSSPHTSGFVNPSSPDTTHTPPECGDDRDSVLDYPMTDVSQIENLQKDTSDPVSQAVTAMSNALDPFLSSFREELGLEGAQADDGMDLLDDLLKSMEEDNPVSPQPPPALPSVPNNPQVNAPEPGRHKSLLRSLLDRGDRSPTKSTMDYSFSSSGPVLKDAVLFSTSSLTSVQSNKTISTMSRSTIPFTSSDSQTQTPILQISNPSSVMSEPLVATIDSSTVSVPQPDPFIPEDLLDFAMQYCDTIPDEQSQAIITSYGQDLWCSGVDDLITTFADVQQSTTEPVTSSAVNTSPAKGPSTQPPQASPEVSFVDLDNCYRKEQNAPVGKQNQCENKQSSTDVSKDISTQILFNVLSNRNTSQMKDSKSNKSVFIQPLKATPRPVVSHTVSSSHVNGPFTSRGAVSAESERCQKLTFRTVPAQPPRSPCRTVGSSVGRVQMATVSASCVNQRCGKSLVSALCDRGAASPSSCLSKSTTPIVPSHQPTQTPSSRHSEQVTAKPSEGMSELEKYLRGYIKRPHADKTSECVTPPQHSTSPPVQTPFLQKLLTGELSREHYREIDSQMLKQEKQRRSSTHSLSDG